MPSLCRRGALAVIAGSAMFSFPFARIALGQQNDDTSREMILNDPEAPIGGNPKGDLTIVAFLDYNCPYCKKSAPDLDRAVREDGKIRLVYKDWPVITPASVHGAQIALAAKYQGKYEAAHHALMNIPGKRVPEEKMTEALRAAGIDMARLQRDLNEHGEAITKLLRRNMAQADALGFRGTPTYLVGSFRTSTLDYAGFKQIITDARARGSK